MQKNYQDTEKIDYVVNIDKILSTKAQRNSLIGFVT